MKNIYVTYVIKLFKEIPRRPKGISNITFIFLSRNARWWMILYCIEFYGWVIFTYRLKRNVPIRCYYIIDVTEIWIGKLRTMHKDMCILINRFEISITKNWFSCLFYRTYCDTTTEKKSIGRIIYLFMLRSLEIIINERRVVLTWWSENEHNKINFLTV